MKGILGMKILHVGILMNTVAYCFVGGQAGRTVVSPEAGTYLGLPVDCLWHQSTSAGGTCGFGTLIMVIVKSEIFYK